MNECFLFIKRRSEIDFRFLIYHKKKAKVVFLGELQNGAKITLFAYDEIADYLYQTDPESLWIQGKIVENMQIEITKVEKIKSKEQKIEQ